MWGPHSNALTTRPRVTNIPYHTLTLVPLIFLSSPSPGYDHLVSITGVVLEHGQHTNYEGIASNKCPLQGQGSSSGAERIVVLLIRSLEYPDTITMYVNVKKGIPLPIGLIPGTTATFYAFKGKTSKSGNIYCASCATSSIQVHSFVDTRSGLSQEADVNGVTPQMSRLPTSYLYDTMMNLLHGRLTRRVLCIRGKFASVQQVSLQFVCLTCHSIVSGGKCRGICSQTVPVLKAEGRYGFNFASCMLPVLYVAISAYIDMIGLVLLMASLESLIATFRLH